MLFNLTNLQMAFKLTLIVYLREKITSGQFESDCKISTYPIEYDQS